jgi:hypothetical protein
LWGAVVALIGITVLGILSAAYANRLLNNTLIILAVGILAFAVSGAYYLAVRMGFERAKLNVVLSLTDRDLICRREGWPEVTIGLAEIKALYDRRSALLVESRKPARMIAIPKDVTGFESLRAELLKHGPLVKPPARAFVAWVPSVAAFLCWPLVLWSSDVDIVKVAGIVLLASLGWLSVTFSTKLNHVPRRGFLRLWLIMSWFGAAFLIYKRISNF